MTVTESQEHKCSLQLDLLTDSAVNVVINSMKKKTPHFSNKKFLPIELNPLKLMIQPRQS